MTAMIRWIGEESDAARGGRKSYGPVPDWPQALLDRHRAAMLKPSEVRQGIRRPEASTVYRTAVLLIPDYAVRRPPAPGPRRFRGLRRRAAKPTERDLFGTLAELLGEIGIGIERPMPLEELVADPALWEHLSQLPRPVRLVELDDGPAVDTWAALQHLRYTLVKRKWGPDADAMRALAGEIALDHVMCGTLLGYGGVPTYDPNGVRESFGGTQFSPEGRFPVTCLAAPPQRTANPPGRRPVIAVLDTGVRKHPWFGNLELAPTPQAATFLRLHKPTQQAIQAQETQLDPGLPKSDILTTYLDEPVFEDTIGEVLNPAVGHGTFIAGVIHQTEPEADVLMLRTLFADNIGLEHDVLLALWLLLARVKEARANNRPADLVDIVSLSIGFYDENPDDGKRARLTEVIDQLIAEGIVVIASAGNEATDRPFLPAALASFSQPPSGEPVIGVGALNPNGSTAWFSNGGRCATCLAPGTAVISIFPPDVRGSAGPSRVTASRQHLDVDDFSGGFAAWSGSSFAAPFAAARVATAMRDLDLDDIGKDEAVARGVKAVTAALK